jgi:hypothetical protein
LVVVAGVTIYLLTREETRAVVRDVEEVPITDPERQQGMVLQGLLNQVNIQLEQAAADQSITPAAPGSPDEMVRSAYDSTDYPARTRVIFPHIEESGYVGAVTNEACTNIAALISEVDTTPYAVTDGLPWVEHLGLYDLVSLDTIDVPSRIAVLERFSSGLSSIQTYPPLNSLTRWRFYLLLGKLLNQRR